MAPFVVDELRDFTYELEVCCISAPFPIALTMFICSVYNPFHIYVSSQLCIKMFVNSIPIQATMYVHCRGSFR